MANIENTYELIDVNPSILKDIEKKMEDGKALVNASGVLPITAVHIAWIDSFSSIIDILDPLGSENGDSLFSRWHKAQFYGGHYPNIGTELSVVFGQRVAVVQSILSGKVKVAKNKNIKKMGKSGWHAFWTSFKFEPNFYGIGFSFNNFFKNTQNRK